MVYCAAFRKKEAPQGATQPLAPLPSAGIQPAKAITEQARPHTRSPQGTPAERSVAALPISQDLVAEIQAIPGMAWHGIRRIAELPEAEARVRSVLCAGKHLDAGTRNPAGFVVAACVADWGRQGIVVPGSEHAAALKREQGHRRSPRPACAPDAEQQTISQATRAAHETEQLATRKAAEDRARASRGTIEAQDARARALAALPWTPRALKNPENTQQHERNHESKQARRCIPGILDSAEIWHDRAYHQQHDEQINQAMLRHGGSDSGEHSLMADARVDMLRA